MGEAHELLVTRDMLEDIHENEVYSYLYRQTWSDSNSDIVPTSDLKPALKSVRQRSISLPGTGLTNFGQIPSITDVQSLRGGWDRLGLYMKGLPPKSLRNKDNAKYRKAFKEHVD